MITPFHDAVSVGLRQHLDPSQQALAQATERLASGLRINRAADDASGQAAAATLSARARSWNAARRSIEMGMDAARIATDGLSASSEALVRMRELAIQAANGTLSDVQRSHLQLELDALTQQIDQVAGATRYNGRLLLSPHRVEVAVVLDTSGTMAPEMPATTAALQAFRTELLAAGVDVRFGLAEVRTSADAIDGVRRLVDLGEAGFDTALAGLSFPSGAIDPYSALLETSGATAVSGAADPDAFAWTAAAAERHIVYISDTGREIDLVSGPDDQTSVGDMVAGRGIAVQAIVSNTGQFGTIASLTGGSVTSIGDASGSGIPLALQVLADAIVERAPSPTFDIQAGITGSPDDLIESGLPVDATAVALGLAGLSIASPEEARAALARIDAALDTVASHQSGVGSLARRLEAALAEARTSHVAAESSRSRIEDADVAEMQTQRITAALRVQGTAEVLLRAADVQRDAILALLSP